MVKLRVKEILREKGITQKEFSAKLGMTEVGLSKAINENGNPDFKRLNEIAETLNISFSELFEQPATDVINCPHCGNKIKIGKE